MKPLNRQVVRVALGTTLFLAGVATGARYAGGVSAQNRFGQPKSVIHLVVYKWKNTTSQDDKDKALAGLRAMAGQIPGIKNIWLKTQRNQIRDFDGVYAIEFASPDAAQSGCAAGLTRIFHAPIEWAQPRRVRARGLQRLPGNPCRPDHADPALSV